MGIAHAVGEKMRRKARGKGALGSIEGTKMGKCHTIACKFTIKVLVQTENSICEVYISFRSYDDASY